MLAAFTASNPGAKPGLLLVTIESRTCIQVTSGLSGNSRIQTCQLPRCLCTIRANVGQIPRRSAIHRGLCALIANTFNYIVPCPGQPAGSRPNIFDIIHRHSLRGRAKEIPLRRSELSPWGEQLSPLWSTRQFKYILVRHIFGRSAVDSSRHAFSICTNTWNQSDPLMVLADPHHLSVITDRTLLV